MGFFEVHGVIDNSAMLIPLEPLLTGSGSVRPLRTKDFRVISDRKFPLARLREWNTMLRSARLVRQCSNVEYQQEIDNLTDLSNDYRPKIVFEQPLGVSHKMGHVKTGLWMPDVIDEDSIIPGAANAAAPLSTLSGPAAAEQAVEAVAVADRSGIEGRGDKSIVATSSSAIPVDGSDEFAPSLTSLAALQIADYTSAPKNLEDMTVDQSELALQRFKDVYRFWGMLGVALKAMGPLLSM
jgi:hypothetical protein